MSRKILRSYKEEYDYSYTSGAYATIEMIKVNPDIVRAVYIHSRYTGKKDINALCRTMGIPMLHDDRAFERINQKENSYVLGVFSKY
ncbi:MAG: TrmH family RNA methyltransferase, partial [Eubacteriales bacterium]|nr:TrmH family RNA methyltransferase [Eubacteriales bacterium]